MHNPLSYPNSFQKNKNKVFHQTPPTLEASKESIFSEENKRREGKEITKLFNRTIFYLNSYFC